MSLQRIIFSAAGAAGAPSQRDPNYRNVPLLLGTSSTNGANNGSFVDSSTNAFTITKFSTPATGSPSPFFGNGYYSVAFDGSGDYLSFPSSTAYTFGTGAFSVECWFYCNINAAGAEGGIISSVVDSAPSTFGVAVYHTSGGNISAYIRSSGTLAFGTSVSFTRKIWNHVVLCRDSTGNAAVFLNGLRIANASNSTNINTNTFTAGRMYTNTLASYSNGYVSGVRCVKGSTPYDPTSSTITVPAGPVLAITNTVLLTCTGPGYTDYSVNNTAITQNGNSAVSRFAPYNLPTAYNTAVYGSSAYFNGSTDYLRCDTALDIFTTVASVYTVEGWAYPLTNTPVFMVGINSNAAGANILLLGNQVIFTNNGTSYSHPMQLNCWTHFAFVSDGTNGYYYLNGVLVRTAPLSTTPLNDCVFGIGAEFDSASGGGASDFFQGYISNLRISTTQVYTSNFTPPSAPFTPGASTHFLLLANNSGIYDTTGGNNLETFGSASSSSIVYKWSPSSAVFDGNNDYLPVQVSNPLLAFNTVNFTIEGWLYRTGVNPVDPAFATTILDYRTTEPEVNIYLLGDPTQKLSLFVNGAYRIVSTTTIPLNTWMHFALVRSSGVTKLYINGAQEGVNYTDTNNYTGSRPTIAGRFAAATGDFRAWPGYIQDFRITNGLARYTANFTPPSSAFPTY